MKLFNSVTQKLEEVNQKRVIKMYTCGPTIYNRSHLGHARTFITFDVIRRVLRHYGYNIHYVVNITDIDDKIINKVKLKCKDGIIHNDIYYDFIKMMEGHFWSDMDKLGVEQPTVITRVTDYIPKIVSFIEQLEKNGYAYESNGSVYFDSQKYKGDGFIDNFFFNNLNTGNEVNEVNEDKYGCNNNSEFTTSEYIGEKKHSADFALWKGSKHGEIKFESKWGYGRPGWHIECSAMAQDILGDLDIHGGGVDLKFPHHTNEIKQMNAFKNDTKYNWTDIFLHSGHLYINNNKMSQSLQNFITIDGFLNNIGTGRLLRLLFLNHTWDKTMDYSDSTLNEAKEIDKRIEGFFNHYKHIMKKSDHKPNNILPADHEYYENFLKDKSGIDMSLRNNVNTRSALNIILQNINNTYKYLDGDGGYNITFVKENCEYLLDILKVLGLKYMHYSRSGNDNEYTSQVIDLAVDFREDMRFTIIKNKKEINGKVLGQLFNILDDFRDNKLKSLGIQLEDMAKTGTKWKKI